MTEENIKQNLEAKFPYLNGRIEIKRERRMFLEINRDNFIEYLEYLNKTMGFTNLSAITGLDDINSFIVIYHLNKDGNIVFNLKVRIARENPEIETVINYFACAENYERELNDLLGINIKGLPEGVRYPLPDKWPKGDHPLRKDWKSKEGTF